jgi:hypothetical protein
MTGLAHLHMTSDQRYMSARDRVVQLVICSRVGASDRWTGQAARYGDTRRGTRMMVEALVFSANWLLVSVSRRS